MPVADGGGIFSKKQQGVLCRVARVSTFAGKLPRLQGDTLTAAGWSEMIWPLSV
jgi:hypothetical protein